MKGKSWNDFIEIKPAPNGGWILKLYEDGEKAGGNRGETDEDYQAFLQVGEEFVGVGQSCVQP